MKCFLASNTSFSNTLYVYIVSSSSMRGATELEELIMDPNYFFKINNMFYRTTKIYKYILKFNSITLNRINISRVIWFSYRTWHVCTADGCLRLSIHRSCYICTLFTPDLYLSNNRSVHLPSWFRRGELRNSCIFPPHLRLLFELFETFPCTSNENIWRRIWLFFFVKLTRAKLNRIFHISNFNVYFLQHKFLYPRKK